MEALLAIYKHTETMSYDDLWLIHDLLLVGIGKKVPRHGLAPLNQIAIPKSIHMVMEQCRQLSPEQIALLIAHVSALFHALAPIESRRGGGGDIEIKFIGRWKLIVLEDRLEIVRVHYGHYAYLRLWTTGGDRNRKRKSLKSIYPGKAVAAVLSRPTLNQAELKSKLIAAYYNGTLDKIISTLLPLQSDEEDEDTEVHQKVVGEIRGDLNQQLQTSLASKQIKPQEVIDAFKDDSLDNLLKRQGE